METPYLGLVVVLGLFHSIGGQNGIGPAFRGQSRVENCNGTIAINERVTIGGSLEEYRYRADWVLSGRESVKFDVILSNGGNIENKWVAIGFSPVKEMRNLDIKMAWVYQNQPTLIDAYVGDQRYMKPAADSGDGGGSDLQEMSVSYQDGVLRMTFTMPLTPVDNRDFNFASGCAYFMLPYTGGRRLDGRNFEKHSLTPMISDQMICLNRCVPPPVCTPFTPEDVRRCDDRCAGEGRVRRVDARGANGCPFCDCQARPPLPPGPQCPDRNTEQVTCNGRCAAANQGQGRLRQDPNTGCFICEGCDPPGPPTPAPPTPGPPSTGGLLCDVAECGRLYTGQAVPWDRNSAGEICCIRPGATPAPPPSCPQTQQEVQARCNDDCNRQGLGAATLRQDANGCFICANCAPRPSCPQTQQEVQARCNDDCNRQQLGAATLRQDANGCFSCGNCATPPSCPQTQQKVQQRCDNECRILALGAAVLQQDQNGCFICNQCQAPNPCNAQTCQNGGTCEAFPDGNFRCNCASGFQGVRCQDAPPTPGPPSTGGLLCDVAECGRLYTGQAVPWDRNSAGEICCIRPGATPAPPPSCPQSQQEVQARCNDDCNRQGLGAATLRQDANGCFICANCAPRPSCPQTQQEVQARCNDDCNRQGLGAATLRQDANGCFSCANCAPRPSCPQTQQEVQARCNDECIRRQLGAATLRQDANGCFSCGNCGPPVQINPCDARPCQNGGSCSVTGESTYSCACPDGFTGSVCEQATSTPAPPPTGDLLCGEQQCRTAWGLQNPQWQWDGQTLCCRRPGTTPAPPPSCPQTQQDVQAECDINCGQQQPGSRGRISQDPNNNCFVCSGCETAPPPVNPCNSRPCQNGGSCEQMSQTEYRCICATGFEGRVCEVVSGTTGDLVCNVAECGRLYAGQAVPWERNSVGDACCRRPGATPAPPPSCPQTLQSVQQQCSQQCNQPNVRPEVVKDQNNCDVCQCVPTEPCRDQATVQAECDNSCRSRNEGRGIVEVDGNGCAQCTDCEPATQCPDYNACVQQCESSGRDSVESRDQNGCRVCSCRCRNPNCPIECGSGIPWEYTPQPDANGCYGCVCRNRPPTPSPPTPSPPTPTPCPPFNDQQCSQRCAALSNGAVPTGAVDSNGCRVCDCRCRRPTDCDAQCGGPGRGRSGPADQYGCNSCTCLPDVGRLCASNPCENGATCRDLGDRYECACVPGYAGINCNLDTNECSSNPCENLGLCLDGVNSFSCQCRAGFSGQTCSEGSGTACASIPCLNGATCRDLPGGQYLCTCAPGFSGRNCERRPANPCLQNPCRNQATCQPAGNQYRCLCGDGYTGNFCETNIDDCAGMPCMNGATCTDQVAGYTCRCADGYSGQNCEERESTGGASVCCDFNDGLCEGYENVFTQYENYIAWSNTDMAGGKILSMSQNDANIQAFLQTDSLGPAVQQCLTLRASIGNPRQGYLELWNQDFSPLWASGDEDIPAGEWRNYQLQLPMGTTRILFLGGTYGGSPGDDILLDDICLKTGECGAVTTTDPCENFDCGRAGVCRMLIPPDCEDPMGACAQASNMIPRCVDPITECPLAMCRMFCQYGFKKDLNDCNKCECEDPCQGFDCPMPETVCRMKYRSTCRTAEGECATMRPTCVDRQTECPVALCGLFCPNGYATDLNGCETSCLCKNETTVPAVCIAATCLVGTECIERCMFGIDLPGCVKEAFCRPLEDPCRPDPCRAGTRCRADPASSNGYTCEIDGPIRCPPTCEMWCEYGMKNDASGCPICACYLQNEVCQAHNCGPNTVCTPDPNHRCRGGGQTCPKYTCTAQTECPLIDCFGPGIESCEYGYMKDANGCDTCDCAPDMQEVCEDNGCGIDEDCVPNRECMPGVMDCGIYNCVPKPVPSDCSPTICAIACEWGMKRDIRGCFICECREEEETCRNNDCNFQQRCVPDSMMSQECGTMGDPTCKRYRCEMGPPRPGDVCQFNRCRPDENCMPNPNCPPGAVDCGAYICDPKPMPDDCGLICLMYCEWGNQRDERGCPICRCQGPEDACRNSDCNFNERCVPDVEMARMCRPTDVSCKKYRCEGPPRPPGPECPMVRCLMRCPYGFRRDEDGCETCMCREGYEVCEPPVCRGRDCPPPPSCPEETDCRPVEGACEPGGRPCHDCLPPVTATSCEFDSPEGCPGWMNMGSYWDEMNWNFTRASSAPEMIGTPRRDCSGSSSGGYMFTTCEMDQPGSRAMLRSPLLRDNQEYCLSFCYQGVPGAAFINAKANISGVYQLLWTGNQGVFTGEDLEWMSIRVTVPRGSNRVIIEAGNIQTAEYGVSVDNMVIEDGPCSSVTDYQVPFMPEEVRQELRELYMGRIDTFPYYYYPVRMRRGMREMNPPMMPLPPDLMDPNPPPRWRAYLVGGNRTAGRLILWDQAADVNGSVCSEEFGAREAMVACNMLGLPGRARVAPELNFGRAPSSMPVLLSGFRCQPHRNNLADCCYNTPLLHSDICSSHFSDVKIVCYDDGYRVPRPDGDMCPRCPPPPPVGPTPEPCTGPNCPPVRPPVTPGPGVPPTMGPGPIPGPRPGQNTPPPIDPTMAPPPATPAPPPVDPTMAPPPATPAPPPVDPTMAPPPATPAPIPDASGRLVGTGACRGYTFDALPFDLNGDGNSNNDPDIPIIFNSEINFDSVDARPLAKFRRIDQNPGWQVDSRFNFGEQNRLLMISNSGSGQSIVQTYRINVSDSNGPAATGRICLTFAFAANRSSGVEAEVRVLIGDSSTVGATYDIAIPVNTPYNQFAFGAVNLPARAEGSAVQWAVRTNGGKFELDVIQVYDTVCECVQQSLPIPYTIYS